jgi:hypothetical protein
VLAASHHFFHRILIRSGCLFGNTSHGDRLAWHGSRLLVVWISRVRRGLIRPLTISQILSSAAGAGAMVIAASAMMPSEFTRFSLFTLIASLLLGLQAAGLLQPALIHQRGRTQSIVPFRYIMVTAPAASVAFLLLAWLLGVQGVSSLAILSFSAAFPLIYDSLRYRAIGLDQRRVVAESDLIRLALTVLALVVPSLPSSSVALQTYLSMSTVLPTLFVSLKLTRVTRTEPFKSYAHAAGWQLLDFAVGQLLMAVPLIFLGTVSRSPLIGGVRLAQSVLGPLNLVFAATTMNLVADGVTRPELATPDSLVRRGTILGRLLGFIALVTIVGTVALLYITGFSLRGVSNTSLLLGVLLVGAWAVGSGWSGVHAVVLRLLGRQARVTLGRALIAGLTLGAFLIGYEVVGVNASLILGFMTVGIASPLVFLTLAARTYRHLPNSLPARNLGSATAGSERKEQLDEWSQR